MTLQPLWPLWALVLVWGGLLVFCAVHLVRQRRHRGAWARRTGAALALGVLLLGPSLVDRNGTTMQTNAEVFFVVDRTGSMAAEDYDGARPRLEGVRYDIPAIVDAFPGGRFTVIGWDSQATRQLPLTTDARAVKSWAETFQQELTSYSAGSQVDRPLAALQEALTGAAERNPNNVRIVYFLSDGENTDGSASSADAELASFEALAPLVDGGAVLGYGTSEGGKMRTYDGVTPLESAPYIPDPTQGGADALSVIDEVTLRTIAEQLGVTYVHRITPDTVEGFTSGIDLEDIAGDGRREEVVYRPVLWPAAAVALGLIAWELFVVARAYPTRLGPDGFESRRSAFGGRRAPARTATPGAGSTEPITPTKAGVR
ncbi:hypothetical protein C8046_10105 [Serinibacter arcticus]|uniref:VWFA domain-containing protein n=1 Tax=Serinibacter arcticus TaxID=1655435 RepID=A0A2U1ZVD6_9MICO|nr:vWA domain-containing protein [Serinibacter arcticus]PWD50955.1 hypothetical protein C8046_10105 [Serinibacter arcticus]